MQAPAALDERLAAPTGAAWTRHRTIVAVGRAAGLTEDMLAHLGDDPVPESVYEPDEAAIVRYRARPPVDVREAGQGGGG